jgi:hypothetical protein
MRSPEHCGSHLHRDKNKPAQEGNTDSGYYGEGGAASELQIGNVDSDQSVSASTVRDGAKTRHTKKGGLVAEAALLWFTAG